MLILNDHQLLLAGGVSLNEPCLYCSQPLRSYPLIAPDTVPSQQTAVEME